MFSVVLPACFLVQLKPPSQGGTPPSVLEPHTLIIDQKTIPHLPAGEPDGGNSSVDILFCNRLRSVSNGQKASQYKVSEHAFDTL